jgi:hypothetical protein
MMKNETAKSTRLWVVTEPGMGCDAIVEMNEHLDLSACVCGKL